MKVEQKRIEGVTLLSSIITKLHNYAYLETLVLVLLYLCIGYLLDPADICILNGQFSYILILLSVITLFHGFESGIFGLWLIAFAMWLFYPIFNYVQFLSTFMMVLIFSEFQYYWTKKIREAETDSEYKNIKLNELSRAFYTLKISHDQLERNYVSKPMSLRNSMMHIKELQGDNKDKFTSFLNLLEKSFNLTAGAIAFLDENTPEDESFNIIAKTSDTLENVDFEDQLVEKSLQLKKPIYISHDETIRHSKYIAVIPALQKERVMGLLLIEKMPFMSYNQENLLSITILLEYFFNEITKENLLLKYNRLKVILDEDYRYEYFRLYEIYKLHKIDSTSLVIKLTNELLAEQMLETIKKLLRSLDMVTLIKYETTFYISVFFPLADKAVAIGFLNRLMKTSKYLDKNQLEYMTFEYKNCHLYDQYISDNENK